MKAKSVSLTATMYYGKGNVFSTQYNEIFDQRGFV